MSGNINDEVTTTVSKMEGRWIALLTTVALAFGGIWLQNQYSTTMKTQEQLSEFMRHVDDRYVQKDVMERLEVRLDRMEGKIDQIRERAIDEREKALIPQGGGR